MTGDYKLGKIGQGCFACQNKFAAGEKIYSCIIEGENSIERKDFCLPCWEKSDKDKNISFWSRKFQKEKRSVVLNKTVAFDLFLRLANSESINGKDFCYVLALLLMRKRVLKLESTCVENNEKQLVLRATGTNTEYKIAEPVLSEERIEYIKQNLSEVFDTDF
ncbi:MAG: hypothetical protein ABIH42_05870 [Planctomycetota bacterium]